MPSRRTYGGRSGMRSGTELSAAPAGPPRWPAQPAARPSNASTKAALGHRDPPRIAARSIIAARAAVAPFAFDADRGRTIMLLRADFEHRDGAGDAAAALDLDLAVADVALHLAGAPDQQAVAHREVALVDAADLGLLDLGLAVGEAAALGDLDGAGLVQRDLDAALDDEAVARRDLAREADPGAHRQALAGLGLGTRAVAVGGQADRGGRGRRRDVDLAARQLRLEIARPRGVRTARQRGVRGLLGQPKR